jgi:hypothetical protein
MIGLVRCISRDKKGVNHTSGLDETVPGRLSLLHEIPILVFHDPHSQKISPDSGIEEFAWDDDMR